MCSWTRGTLTDFGISGHKNERLTIRDFRKSTSGLWYLRIPPTGTTKKSKDTKLFTLDIYSFGVVFYELSRVDFLSVNYGFRVI